MAIGSRTARSMLAHAPIVRDPEIAVLFPLYDAREDALANLRTWTRDQTLERSRFQLVVGARRVDAALADAVLRELEPHDVLASCEANDEADLWQAAAGSASARWLLVTEAHCRAQPDCLEVIASALAAHPELAAASLGLDHERRGHHRELLPRWFEDHFEVWGDRAWTQLVAFGFLIRASLFRELGGLEPRYGLFASWVLSARLHATGSITTSLPQARVRHIHNPTIAHHHDDSRNHARGACEAGRDLDPVFFETYFGFDGIAGDRLRYAKPLARAAMGSLARVAASRGMSARDRSSLAGELMRWLPAAASGARSARVCARIAAATATLITEGAPLSRARRYRAFLQAQERTVTSARLDWVAEQRAIASPAAWAAGRRGVEQFEAEQIVGVHGLETVGGAWFRWTRPVFLLRPAMNGVESVRLDTIGLRGSPSDYVLGAFAGHLRVKRAQLTADERRLRIDLSRRERQALDAGGGLRVVCRPLLPSDHGSADARRLGMPLSAVELGTGT